MINQNKKVYKKPKVEKHGDIKHITQYKGDYDDDGVEPAS